MDIFITKTGGFPPLVKCSKGEININFNSTRTKRKLSGLNVGLNIHNILKSRRIKKPFN
jgi:hypothetical protein